jgi:hypothetical protein
MKTIKNLLLILTFLILIQNVSAYTSPATINLGLSGNFTVLSGAGITSVPPLNVTGNIGTFLDTADSNVAYPGISCGNVSGTIFARQSLTPIGCEVVIADPAMGNALTSGVTTAYGDGMGRGSNATVTGLAGLTLYPGVYDSTGVTIATNVTLDSNGSSSGVFIFKISGTLVSTGGSVNLTNGTQASNVFWLVSGTSAIGSGTTFYGNIIGQQTIAIGTTAKVYGRLISSTDVTFAGGNSVYLVGNVTSSNISITSFTPPTPVSSVVNTTQTFTIATNQTATIVWSINGTTKQTNTSVTSASYSNSTATVGNYIVTATASNDNGSITQIWTWTVTNASAPTPSLPVTLAAGRASTCGSLMTYESAIMSIFGLALMILGFAVVLFSLKNQNGAAILSGIMTMIIGFAMLILGNYILYAIFGALC